MGSPAEVSLCAQLGAGRFARLGLPHPKRLGPFVGTTKIMA
jgi:hypothetical protein